MDYKYAVMNEDAIIAIVSKIFTDFDPDEDETLLDLEVAVAKAQAELSFKAGQEAERKGGTNSIAYLEGLQEGTRQGQKEVVDWMINDSYDTTIHFGEDWQEKLKEWGLLPSDEIVAHDEVRERVYKELDK